MTAQMAIRALRLVRYLLEELREKALSVLGDSRERGLVASSDQEPFRRCGLPPRTEEFERGSVRHGRLAGGVHAQDHVAKLIARGFHDDVEHRIERGEVDLHGRQLHAGGAGDPGCGERSRGDTRVAKQHLRSIRFNLIDLAHVDRMTDGACLRAAARFGVGSSPLARAVRDMTREPMWTELAP